MSIVGDVIEVFWEDGKGLFTIVSVDKQEAELKAEESYGTPEEGTRVDFEFDDSGQFFRISGTVSSYKDGRMSVAVQDAHAIQRRECVRVPVNIRVGLELDESDEYLVCHSMDISAGGIEIECERDLREGQRCSVILTFPEDREPTSLISRVVRSRLLGRYPLNYAIGLEFLVLPRETAEKIVRYIFELQREIQRSRRLGG